MGAFDWFLVAWWIFGSLIAVAQVGKPRTPTEPLTAAIIVAIQLGLIAALLVARGAI